MATLELKLSIPKDVILREIAGEAVILNLQTGRYFGLDEVGTRMWQLLAQHNQSEPALNDLTEGYDTSKDQLQHDLLDLSINSLRIGWLKSMQHKLRAALTLSLPDWADLLQAWLMLLADDLGLRRSPLAKSIASTNS
jgi:hypothetical protein